MTNTALALNPGIGRARPPSNPHGANEVTRRDNLNLERERNAINPHHT
jgi:hypothetical protein